MNRMLQVAAFCGIMITSGCVSLDDRLASADPHVRSAAERELIHLSRATGTEADRIAAVKRIADRDYLYEIALHATTNQWAADDSTFDASPYDGFIASSDGKTRVYYELRFVRADGELSDYTRVRGRTIDTTGEGVAAVGQLKFDDSKEEDFVKLFDLIGKAESDTVKLAAFKAAKDPKRSRSLAEHLVRCTTNASIQNEALATMDPERRLIAIALYGADGKARLDAFGKLKDQKAIDDLLLKTRDKGILLAGMDKTSDKAALALRIFDKDFLCDGEMLDMDLALGFLKRVGDVRKEIWGKFAEQGRLQEIETRMARLYREKCASMSDADKGALISAITTPEIIAKLIVSPTKKEAEASGKPTAKSLYVVSKDDREATFRFMSPDVAYSIATNAIVRQTTEDWNREDVSHLEFAASLIRNIKDEKMMTGALLRLLDTMGEYRRMCETHDGWKWTATDMRQARGIMGKCRDGISDSVREQALMQVDTPYAGIFLVDNLSPASACRLLVSRRIRCEGLESDLAKKIDKDKIDIRLYDSVRTDLARKVLAGRAPSSVKPLIQKRRDAAVVSLLLKAKAQGEATFELKGFYLGMPIGDAKELVEYYLPEVTAVITKDNNLELDPKPREKFLDTDRYSEPQEMYFCQADKAGKVWRLNFDRRFLRKWFSYDVQDWREWALEYGKESNFDFRRITVKREISNDHYQVYMNYSQPAYRYCHNRKGFVVSYYGKVNTDGFSNVDESDLFAGGFRTERVGFVLGAHVKLREYFENGDGAKEGTLRVEVMKD